MNKEQQNQLEKRRIPIQYDAVVFDVDSTLVTIEGLDWLAEKKGVESDVARLTKQSMDGFIDFQGAMAQKMKILAPTHEDMMQMGNAYCDHIVPGVLEVLTKLKAQGKEVWIISGNFQPAVNILAAKLGIPFHRVLCNQIFFDEQGKYAGFDTNNPLAKNGGKAEKIQDVLEHKRKNIVFIGDSKTDLEVKGHVALFIGFGGVVEREIVKRQADYYIQENNLLRLLYIILPKAGKPTEHKISAWKSMAGTHTFI